MSPTGSLSLYSKHLTPMPTLHSKHKFAYLTLQELFPKSKQRFQSSKCLRNLLLDSDEPLQQAKLE